MFYSMPCCGTYPSADVTYEHVADVRSCSRVQMQTPPHTRQRNEGERPAVGETMSTYTIRLYGKLPEQATT